MQNLGGSFNYDFYVVESTESTKEFDVEDLYKLEFINQLNFDWSTTDGDFVKEKCKVFLCKKTTESKIFANLSSNGFIRDYFNRLINGVMMLQFKNCFVDDTLSIKGSKLVKKVKDTEFTKGHFLGTSQFPVVDGTFYRRGGRKKYNLAIKIVSTKQMEESANPQQHFKFLINEMQNIYALAGPNADPKHHEVIPLCMERMDCNLLSFIRWYHKNHKTKVPEEIFGIIAASVLQALFYCKGKQIIHRDIKPANILINKNGQVKLADFGLSRVMDNSEATTLHIGTFGYRAPELIVLGNWKYNDSVDIFSLGITLTELVNGRHPAYESSSNFLTSQQLNSYIIEFAQNHKKSHEIANTLFLDYSDASQWFIRESLQPVEKRHRIKEIVESEFFKEYNERRTQNELAENEIFINFVIFLATQFDSPTSA